MELDRSVHLVWRSVFGFVLSYLVWFRTPDKTMRWLGTLNRTLQQMKWGSIFLHVFPTGFGFGQDLGPKMEAFSFETASKATVVLIKWLALAYWSTVGGSPLLLNHVVMKYHLLGIAVQSPLAFSIQDALSFSDDATWSLRRERSTVLTPFAACVFSGDALLQGMYPVTNAVDAVGVLSHTTSTRAAFISRRTRERQRSAFWSLLYWLLDHTSRIAVHVFEELQLAHWSTVVGLRLHIRISRYPTRWPIVLLYSQASAATLPASFHSGYCC